MLCTSMPSTNFEGNNEVVPTPNLHRAPKSNKYPTYNAAILCSPRALQRSNGNNKIVLWNNITISD